MEEHRRLAWVRPVERPFIHRAQDWVDGVSARGTWQLTDFLTPREQVLLESVVRSQGLVSATDGGYPEAERRRALIMPDDWCPQPEDFAVAVLQASSRAPGFAPSHGDVLGSILGTGVDRRKIGDISVSRQGILVAVCRDIVPYLLAEWRHVGRHPVDVSVASASLAWETPAYQPEVISISSLRLDAVLAHACRLSRGRAQAAIAAGQVMLNFAECTRPDETVEPGDVISVRGFGRVRIDNVIGVSKKERIRLEVGVLRSR